MQERECFGVQERSSEATRHRDRARAAVPFTAVQRVAHHRMARFTQVYANLVGTASADAQVDQGDLSQWLNRDDGREG